MDVQPTQNPPPKPSNPPILLQSDTLKVFLRVRPLPIAPTSKPLSKSSKLKQTKTKKRNKSCVTINDSHSVTISPPCDSNRSKSEIYTGFANVFSPDSSQDEVYEKLMRSIVEEFLNGKSGLLAAVGPSGSGKTHTVFGSAKDPGLMPRALRHILEPGMSLQSKPYRSFYLSMFEIYSERGKGEKLSDLSPDGADIYMQQSAVKGLQEVLITDAAHAEFLVCHAMAKRATAMTNSNSQSSRSQCIINIRYAVDEIDGYDAVLTFVDLAGAEREKRTGNQGGRLLESHFINNTSMVFSLCLRSLLEHQKNPKKPLQKHFQSSMLTRYLREYLEGRKRMALILTVRSGEEDYFDTSFLLRQASPYMEIKFNNVEDTLNLPGNKRQGQTKSTNQQKRVKLSGADACKDHVQRTSNDSIDFCKQGLSVGCQRDQTSRVNSNEVPKANCNDAGTEREYHIMRGFAKALWNVLKQYKEKVKTAENEVGMLTENLRIVHDQYLVMEKELHDLKARCSCKFSDSADVAMSKPDSEEEPRSAFVSLVHLGEFPTSTKNSETISDNGVSDAILRKSSQETSAQKNHQVEHSLMRCEISCDHVSEVDCEEELTNKDDRKSAGGAACSSRSHVTDHMVLGKSFGCNTRSQDVNEIVSIGQESDSWSEQETKKRSCSRPSNARRPKRKSAENYDSKEECTLGSRLVPIGPTVLRGPKTSCDAEAHGNFQVLPTCNKNSDSFDVNREPDAILRKTFQVSNLPSNDCESSAPQIHQSLIECEISKDQSRGVACHKKDISKKDNEEAADADACLPQPDKGCIVQGESSGCGTDGNEDKEKVAIGPGSSSNSKPETKQTSNCKPLNQGRPKRRLMPASSLLLRDISGLEVADESDNVKKGKGGQRLVEDESKRSRGDAFLLRVLKNHLPR